MDTPFDNLSGDAADSRLADGITEDVIARNSTAVYVIRNRAHWDKLADDFVASGERGWQLAPGEDRWGIFDDVIISRSALMPIV
jgi:hypothetical protein